MDDLVAWLLRDDASLVLQLNALLPRVHGEPRFVALTALSHVAGCDAASGAAYAERMLPQLPALLAARDPQVHVAVLRTLGRCLPGLAEEAARWPNGRKIDENAWRSGMERAEAALWGAADLVVRDAHADLCVAVAAAIPVLADHPAVRAPLLRALANGGGGRGGIHAGGDGAGGGAEGTSAVLSHWHARLPGNPVGLSSVAATTSGGGGGGGGGNNINTTNAHTTAGGADDNAAAGNLGRRLCAALDMLPTARGHAHSLTGLTYFA